MNAGFLYISGRLLKDENGYRSNSIMNMYAKFSSVFNIDLICPVSNDVADGSHLIDLSSMTLHPLRSWRGWQDLYFLKLPFLIWRILRIVREKRKSWDILWITDYTPATQLCFIIARIYCLPTVLYLRGDLIREIRSKNHKGLKGLLARLYCGYYEKTLPWALSRCITVVTGKVLYDKYRDSAAALYQYMASAVTRKDLKSLATAGKREQGRHLRLIYVGNLVVYKAVDVLLNSIAQLRKIGVECFLDIVGTGAAEQDLRAMAKDLCLDDFVSFKGFVPFGEDLFSLYRSSDVYVLPSLTEGTPKTIAEAMACGLPVLASRVGGLPDMIDHGSEGFLLKPGDVQELTDAILKLSKNRDLLSEMSKNALRRAEFLTVDSQLERLRDFLLPLVSRKAAERRE